MVDVRGDTAFIGRIGEYTYEVQEQRDEDDLEDPFAGGSVDRRGHCEDGLESKQGKKKRKKDDGAIGSSERQEAKNIGRCC